MCITAKLLVEDVDSTLGAGDRREENHLELNIVQVSGCLLHQMDSRGLNGGSRKELGG